MNEVDSTNSGASANGGIENNSTGGVTEVRATTSLGTTERLATAKELAHMKRLMDGAYKRLEGLGKERDRLRRNISQEEVKDGSDAGAKPRKATEADLIGYHAKMKKVQVKLAEAKLQYNSFKKRYRTAYMKDYTSSRQGVKDTRLEMKMNAKASNLVDQVAELLRDLAGGDPSRTELLSLHAAEGKRRAFREELENLLKENNAELLQEISSVKKVKTRIIVAVMTRVKNSTKIASAEVQQ